MTTYIGRDCKRGHGGQRSLASKKCIVCAREAFASYRAKNPEKARASYLKWLSKNIDRERARSVLRRVLEPDKIRANARAYRQRNIEKDRARCLKYQQNNLHRYAANTAIRRAIQKNRTPKWADIEKIMSIYKMASEMSILSGAEYQVDHVIPLNGRRVSGLHVPENLAVIAAHENMRKGNRYHVA